MPGSNKEERARRVLERMRAGEVELPGARPVVTGVDMGLPAELMHELEEKIDEEFEAARWELFTILVRGIASDTHAVQALDMGRQPEDLEVRTDGLFEMATTMARRYMARAREELDDVEKRKPWTPAPPDGPEPPKPPRGP